MSRLKEVCQLSAAQAEVAKADRDRIEAIASTEDKMSALAAEAMHHQRTVESQAKDMKKMMRENSNTLLEFEKALARKSGECNVRVMN